MRTFPLGIFTLLSSPRWSSIVDNIFDTVLPKYHQFHRDFYCNVYHPGQDDAVTICHIGIQDDLRDLGSVLHHRLMETEHFTPEDIAVLANAIGLKR